MVIVEQRVSVELHEEFLPTALFLGRQIELSWVGFGRVRILRQFIFLNWVGGVVLGVRNGGFGWFFGR